MKTLFGILILITQTAVADATKKALAYLPPASDESIAEVEEAVARQREFSRRHGLGSDDQFADSLVMDSVAFVQGRVVTLTSLNLAQEDCKSQNKTLVNDTLNRNGFFSRRFYNNKAQRIWLGPERPTKIETIKEQLGGDELIVETLIKFKQLSKIEAEIVAYKGVVQCLSTSEINAYNKLTKPAAQTSEVETRGPAIYSRIFRFR